MCLLNQMCNKDRYRYSTLNFCLKNIRIRSAQVNTTLRRRLIRMKNNEKNQADLNLDLTMFPV